MKAIIAGCFVLVLAANTEAKWEKLTIENAVRNSDLVVHAVLTNIERTESNDVISCKGTLQIKETLKGQSTNAVVLVWSFCPALSDPNDHTPWRNMQMVWLLTRASSGQYVASHPVRVQPIAREKDIINILRTRSSQAAQVPVPKVATPWPETIGKEK